MPTAAPTKPIEDTAAKVDDAVAAGEDQLRLRCHLREPDAPHDLDEVVYAILERNGRISIIPKEA